MSDEKQVIKQDAVLVVDGRPYKLLWNKRALYFADRLGLFSGESSVKGSSIGLATTVQYVWCMLPNEGRKRFPTPDELAAVMPPLAESMEQVSLAISNSSEEMDPKKVFGSMSGPSS